MASVHGEEGKTESGMQEACGVFGCVAAGDWPSGLDIGHIITLGLTGLQHRLV